MPFEDKNKNEISIRKADSFSVNFPDNNILKDKEKKEIQKAIMKGGIVEETKTFINEKGVQTLLGTDKKGVQILLNDAPNEDVKEYNDIEYLSTPHIQKEIAKRKEQPRPELDREKLSYASEALKAFSGNAQLEKERTIGSDRIVSGRPMIGKKTIKKRGSTVSEISGEPLNGNACVHHVDRVADKPEKTFDDNNLVVLTAAEHKKYHRSNYRQDEEGFKKFIAENINDKS